jgi:DNA-binding NarL/FixJ family response regulator
VTADVSVCPHYPGDRSSTVRVLVVDDHDGVRTALVELLSLPPDLTVVGECGDGAEVVAAVERLRPDVVLMDVQMPGVDGLTATRDLLAVRPDVGVVILTSRAGVAPAALAAGARGSLSRGDDPMLLLRCIRSAAVGCACCLEAAEPPAAGQ